MIWGWQSSAFAKSVNHRLLSLVVNGLLLGFDFSIKQVDAVYNEVITAGTHTITESIKVAGAAKVTDNSKRDLNIATQF